MVLVEGGGYYFLLYGKLFFLFICDYKDFRIVLERERVISFICYLILFSVWGRGVIFIVEFF